MSLQRITLRTLCMFSNSRIWEQVHKRPAIAANGARKGFFGKVSKFVVNGSPSTISYDPFEKMFKSGIGQFHISIVMAAAHLIEGLRTLASGRGAQTYAVV